MPGIRERSQTIRCDLLLRSGVLLTGTKQIPSLQWRMTMAQNTFHVALYVEDISIAVDRYKKILGIEPAKVRHDYAKFEISDPPVIFSLNVGSKPGTLSHLGIRYPGTGEVATEMIRTRNEGLEQLRQEGVTCCYAKADKFWVRDADQVPWEMYALLADADDAQTAADPELRAMLGQPSGAKSQACCGSGETAPE
jgi:catechol 2,3-dioxygenase-like lactoylglutathione lyase family enzyme